MSAHWAALLPLPQPAGSSPIDAAALGAWALQFTPRVALREGAALAELAASARLFGGLERLHQRVQQGAADLGARVAWASTGLAALALARQGGLQVPEGALARQLDALPLHTLTAVGQHQATLERVGCRTLGQVRRLPRGALVRRFGTALLAALDQAYGLQPEAYDWIAVPQTFEARLELMARVEHAPALLAGARRLLVQMAGWLAARRCGVRAFTLHWCHDALRPRDAGSGGSLTVRTARPTQSVAHCMRLLAEHLARVVLDAPVGDIALHADEVEPWAEESCALLPDALRQGADAEQALERIQARLGPQAVRTPVLHADHRPEYMQHWHSALAGCPAPGGKAPAARAPRGALAGAVLPQPPWLLDAPLRLMERQHRPYYQGPLQLLLGPDRVEGGWWHRSGQGGDAQTRNVQRDYWLARSPQAGLLGVFQQRLAGDETAWFLHGLYA